MEKPKLDLDKLLDDWAEQLFLEADNLEKKKELEETGSFKHGYYKGRYDGIITAIAKLSILENRKNEKYKINTKN